MAQTWAVVSLYTGGYRDEPTNAAVISTSSSPGLLTSRKRTNNRIATNKAARQVKIVVMTKTFMFINQIRRRQCIEPEMILDSDQQQKDIIAPFNQSITRETQALSINSKISCTSQSNLTGSATIYRARNKVRQPTRNSSTTCICLTMKQKQHRQITQHLALDYHFVQHNLHPDPGRTNQTPSHRRKRQHAHTPIASMTLRL